MNLEAHPQLAPSFKCRRPACTLSQESLITSGSNVSPATNKAEERTIIQIRATSRSRMTFASRRFVSSLTLRLGEICQQQRQSERAKGAKRNINSEQRERETIRSRGRIRRRRTFEWGRFVPVPLTRRRLKRRSGVSHYANPFSRARSLARARS